jgi:cytidyltransferase-like protein
MKTYQTGLYCGRFQPPHLGHQQIVARMKTECERAVILIGPAQAYRNRNSPLSYFEVRRLWRMLEPDGRVVIGFHNDLVKGSPYWPDWLREHCRIFSGSYPDAIYGGPDMRGQGIWQRFPEVSLHRIDTRLAGIQGREIRQSIIEDTPFWRTVTDQRIHPFLLQCRQIFVDTQEVETSPAHVPTPEIVGF